MIAILQHQERQGSSAPFTSENVASVFRSSVPHTSIPAATTGLSTEGYPQGYSVENTARMGKLCRLWQISRFIHIKKQPPKTIRKPSQQWRAPWCSPGDMEKSEQGCIRWQVTLRHRRHTTFLSAEGSIWWRYWHWFLMATMHLKSIREVKYKYP